MRLLHVHRHRSLATVLNVTGSDGPIFRLEDSLLEDGAVYKVWVNGGRPSPWIYGLKLRWRTCVDVIFFALMSGYGGYERVSAQSTVSLFSFVQ